MKKEEKKKEEKKMKNIPIALRTRNRPVYLDLTLRSLTSSKLPKDPRIVILDDCSDDPIARKYLFTDEKIILKESYRWKPNGHVGAIPEVSQLRGIKDKFEIVQPERRKGVMGGVFWCINHMMNKFPEDEAIILIEADAVFNEEWYTATMRAYEHVKNLRGLNGKQLGLLSAYDRKPTRIKTASINRDKFFVWRSVKRIKGRGSWNCGNGIGGVMYLVTRDFYNATHAQMTRTYNANARGGDTALQALCGIYEYNIATTYPSFVQHIGYESLAWPKKNWRKCRNFIKPFCLKKYL